MHYKKLKVFFTALVLSSLIPNVAGAASYTVAKGDSLYTIGELFGTSYSRIMSDNSLSGSTIYPGQKLEVPAKTYTVKSGDSLYLIAKAHQVSLDSLRKANNKWDDMIYAGQTLLIPGKNSGETASGNSITLSSAAQATISYSNAEHDLLARLITAEANNQPYQAKLGVGAVVVNRVKDPRFPNSISGVIYEVTNGYYQFTPVQNGMINKPASADAKKAATEVLNGADPTNGAVFFFDDSATNKWLWSKPIALRSGKMVFTY